jgi:hypothetical protein
MKVMITTSGGDIDLHDRIVEIINKIYDLEEYGSNGGKGYYFTNADTDYPHISLPFSSSSTLGYVEILVGTIDDDDDDDDGDD